LFREFFKRWEGDALPRERRQQSRGSGVVVRSNGTVLTNNHVVEGADAVKVTLSDGREFDAEVIGSDPRSDLAVLRLDGADGLTPLPFGDSTGLRLGEMVLAIGNPFGLEGTVTMGIVSAKGRADVGIVDYEDFIQTDAAINPGNSGGALVNTRGELVGINTAILSRNGGYQGIGFAIPSDMAKSIMDSLLENGRVARGWLGVLIQDLRPELAEAFDIDQQSGALIADVALGSPAKSAGLRRGDVVIAVSGRPIHTSGELRNQIALKPPGSRVKLRLLRDGSQKTLPVVLGELPSDSKNATKSSVDRSDLLAGIVLGPLDETNRRRFGIGEDIRSGLVVLELTRDSRARHSGLRAGDVIVEVNRKAVRRLLDVEGASGDTSGRLLLLVQREGSTIYMVLTE